MKKWSMNEKWFGAMIAGPSTGTLSESMQRVRKNVSRYGVRNMRTTWYMWSGRPRRVRSWYFVKYSAGRSSL
jgi:hypothetical protein